MSDAPSIGMSGLGVWAPPRVVDAAVLAEEMGISAAVLRDKFGIRQVHRAGDDCHVSDMAVAAGAAALADAGLEPDAVDLVVYCGSEYKDFIVWSAAAAIAHRLDCRRAQVFEVYALCAGMPLTLRVARDMMLAEPELRTVLVVAASKESALVDRRNRRSRFMFNFGDGAAAAVIQRGLARNLVLGSASVTDGSLSEDAVIPAGGSRQPASAETVAAGQHRFDVPGLEHMRARLDVASLANFRHVVREALRRSSRDRVDFLASVHMKRSMYDGLLRELRVVRSFYLEDYGHMQAADQIVALAEARERGLLRDGDTVVLVAAGVGYTWAATVVAWGDQTPRE